MQTTSRTLGFPIATSACTTAQETPWEETAWIALAGKEASNLKRTLELLMQEAEVPGNLSSFPLEEADKRVVRKSGFVPNGLKVWGDEYFFLSLQVKRIAYQTLVRTLKTATQVQRSRKAAEAQGQGLVVFAKNQAHELMQLGVCHVFASQGWHESVQEYYWKAAFGTRFCTFVHLFDLSLIMSPSMFTSSFGTIGTWKYIHDHVHLNRRIMLL